MSNTTNSGNLRDTQYVETEKALSLPDLYSGTMQKYFKNYILLLLIAAGSIIPAQAQKIGFADLELILAFMPEAAAIDRDLQSYSEQLQKSIQTKEAYLQTKFEEFQAEIAAGGENFPQTRIQEMEGEVQKLQLELQQSQADAEQKLMIRRQDKLNPILDKVQRAIDTLAEEEGYTYIFNATSGGTSMVLFAGEQYNVTKTLMERLGIEIPEELEE